MQHYDFIIAGGGAAGLSLALHLVCSPLRERSILIIDRDRKLKNDRTFGFWSYQAHLFDQIVYRTYHQLQVIDQDYYGIFDLAPYRYQVIRGIDFYRHAWQELETFPNVTFLHDVITDIEDGEDCVRVTTNSDIYSADWVFDSLPRPRGSLIDPLRYNYQQLHFRGWEIESQQAVFNPGAVTFLDFRTPQVEGVPFFYVLPHDEQHALVEYTIFSKTPLRRQTYERALKDYIEKTLNIRDYRILAQENGVIPVNDQPVERRAGQRVLTIGAKGGRIKPTTGYAFQRFQEDSTAIVRSLLEYGHPYNLPRDSRRYRVFDSILLHVMTCHNRQIRPIFKAMFRNNPIQRNLRFLDEVATPWENLSLIATLPPRVFLLSLLQIGFKQALWSYRQVLDNLRASRVTPKTGASA